MRAKPEIASTSQALIYRIQLMRQSDLLKAKGMQNPTDTEREVRYSYEGLTPET